MFFSRRDHGQTSIRSTEAVAAPAVADERIEEPKVAKKRMKTRQAGDFVVTPDIRQAALLAEGVAHALCDEPESRDSALSCFRQLQEWPGSEATVRQQAAYNEAIVFRAMGYPGQSVLLLTELLGDRIPDTGKAPVVHGCWKPLRADLPEAICYPARLARLAAFSQYTNVDWSTLPGDRAELLLSDARELVDELDKMCEKRNLSTHDRALVKYMLVDALRAGGHVELMNAINRDAQQLYDADGRPSHLIDEELRQTPSGQTRKDLARAIEWMRLCEQYAPDAGLYCDIAEASLLLRDFRTAQAYARHATLQASPTTQSAAEVSRQFQNDPNYERAFYLATESFYLDGKKSVAQKYLDQFGRAPTMDAFKALSVAMQQLKADSNAQTRSAE
jgi:hypothetical protein